MKHINSPKENSNPQPQPYSRQSTTNRKFVCFYCGQPGHYARSCYSNPNRQTDKSVDQNRQNNTDTHVYKSRNLDSIKGHTSHVLPAPVFSLK